jgi:hypothetical protein
MDELVWIRLHVEMSSHYGAQADDYVSVPRAKWDAMSEAEQEKWIEEAVEEHLANTVSAGGDVVDAADVPEGYDR